MSADRWLITGASGQLGGHVVRRLAADGERAHVLALSRSRVVRVAGVEARQVDLGDTEALVDCVGSYGPTHVIHVGAVTSVTQAHADPQTACRVNTLATQRLAQCAADCGARLVFSSTDMVFDGEAAPYGENDPPKPLSHYGRTKAEAEQLLTEFERTLVVRLPLMYGYPCERRETTFVRQIVALRAGEPLRLFADEFRTPIWLADAAASLIELARSEVTGLLHVAGPQRLSRYQMVEEFARLLGVRNAKLEPASRLSIAAAEPRPADLSLDGSRFTAMFPHLTPGPIRAEALVQAP